MGLLVTAEFLGELKLIEVWWSIMIISFSSKLKVVMDAELASSVLANSAT